MNNIAFIGAGNMCRAIVSGLVSKGYAGDNIMVSNPSPEKRVAMAKDFAIKETADNIAAARFADIIILSVKPQFITEVCAQIAEQMDISKKCFISVAAGTTMAQMEQALASPCAVIRAMPNTPSQLGLGVTGLYANADTDAKQKAIAEQLMQAVGIVMWLDTEAQIDDIICVSGSGPAYFFLFMEAMEQQALARGFSAADARRLVQQTALGAAQMVVQNDIPISELRANVTSKGGTTNAAITAFIDGGLQQLVTKAMDAALHRAKEMAQNNNVK